MNDDYKGPTHGDLESARVSERVAAMSDAERAALARRLAGRPQTGAAAPSAGAFKRPVRRPPAETPDDGRAKAAARLTVELRRTQGHLARVERAISPSRFGGGTSSSAAVRYDRLLRRAERLERQLRALR
jgi:hypothetical protein